MRDSCTFEHRCVEPLVAMFGRGPAIGILVIAVAYLSCFVMQSGMLIFFLTIIISSRQSSDIVHDTAGLQTSVGLGIVYMERLICPFLRILLSILLSESEGKM